MHPPPIRGAAVSTAPTRAPGALTWALAAELLPPSTDSPCTSDANSGASRPCAPGTPSDPLARIRGDHTAVETASHVKRPAEHTVAGTGERESAETRPGRPDLSENRRTRDREAISTGARGTTERNESRRRWLAAERRRERAVGTDPRDAAARWLRQHGGDEGTATD
jgi:hypothetical protein